MSNASHCVVKILVTYIWIQSKLVCSWQILPGTAVKGWNRLIGQHSFGVWCYFHAFQDQIFSILSLESWRYLKLITRKFGDLTSSTWAAGALYSKMGGSESKSASSSQVLGSSSSRPSSAATTQGRIYVSKVYLTFSLTISIVSQKLKIPSQIIFDRRQICLLGWIIGEF